MLGFLLGLLVGIIISLLAILFYIVESVKAIEREEARIQQPTKQQLQKWAEEGG